jgi:hypothetical protein
MSRMKLTWALSAPLHSIYTDCWLFRAFSRRRCIVTL